MNNESQQKNCPTCWKTGKSYKENVREALSKIGIRLKQLWVKEVLRKPLKCYICKAKVYYGTWNKNPDRYKDAKIYCKQCGKRLFVD